MGLRIGTGLSRAGQPSDLTTGQTQAEQALGDVLGQVGGAAFPAERAPAEAPADTGSFPEEAPIGTEEAQPELSFEELLNQEVADFESLQALAEAPTDFNTLLEEEANRAGFSEFSPGVQRTPPAIAPRTQFTMEDAQQKALREFEEVRAQLPPLTPEQGIKFSEQAKLGLFDTEAGQFKFLQNLYGPENVRFKSGSFEWRPNPKSNFQSINGDGLNWIANMAGRFLGNAPQFVGTAIGSGLGAVGGPLGMAGGAGVGSIVGDTIRIGIKHISDLDKFEPINEEILQRMFGRAMLEAGFAGFAGSVQRTVEHITGASILQELYEKAIPTAQEEALARSAREIPGGPPPAQLGPGEQQVREALSEEFGGRLLRQDPPRELTQEMTGKDTKELAKEFGIDDVLPSQVTESSFVTTAEEIMRSTPKEQSRFIDFAIKQARQIEDAKNKIMDKIVPVAKRKRGRRLGIQVHNEALERHESFINGLSKRIREAHKNAADKGETVKASKLLSKLEEVMDSHEMFETTKRGIIKIADYRPDMGIDRATYKDLLQLYRNVTDKSFRLIGARKGKPAKVSELVDPSGRPIVKQAAIEARPGVLIPDGQFTIQSLDRLRKTISKMAKIDQQDNALRQTGKESIGSLYRSIRDDLFDGVQRHSTKEDANQFRILRDLFAQEADQLRAFRKLVQENRDNVSTALLKRDSGDLHQMLHLLDDKTHREIALDYLDKLIQKTRVDRKTKLGRIGPDLLKELVETDQNKLNALFDFKDGDVYLKQFMKFARLVHKLDAIDIRAASSQEKIVMNKTEEIMAFMSRFFFVRHLVRLFADYPNAKTYLSERGFRELTEGTPIRKRTIGAGMVGAQAAEEFAQEDKSLKDINLQRRDKKLNNIFMKRMREQFQQK